jgi:hypothetical protein
MHIDPPSSLVTVVPFLLLLALWFVLLKMARSGRSSPKSDLVEPMREMLQTLLIPEIRALRESIDGLRADIKSIESAKIAE